MSEAIRSARSEPSSSEHAVRSRYSAAARDREPALCCPVDYDRRLLEVIPDEVIERDYGCGDPSRHVRPGDTVLDLGSGGGKVCFIASQIVGSEGHVIGVDANDDMLELARFAAPTVAEGLGYANVEFRRGRIQDLTLDSDRLAEWLVREPVTDLASLERLENETNRLRSDEPMIPDQSVDIIVSNCVLNLVSDEDRCALVNEIFRVLRPGGRIAISDIVSDEVVPEALRQDPVLFSGCISGAFEEMKLLEELERVGFYGIIIDKWEHEPFAVVDGIEFRAVTITAMKGKEGPSLDANQALIYSGPWRQVEDDDGHVFRRGERVAVCAKTLRLLTEEPYAGQLIAIEPRIEIAQADRSHFDSARATHRHPRETKGQDWDETRAPDVEGSCCG
jgi:SAM-dependent methyltransferase